MRQVLQDHRPARQQRRPAGGSRPGPAPATARSVNTSCSRAEARSWSSWSSMIRACTASVISTNGTSRPNTISGSPCASAAAAAKPPAARRCTGGRARPRARSPPPRRGRRRRRRAAAPSSGSAIPVAEHQLAAAQQPGRVGELDRVHPAHRGVQPVRPGHHPRLPAPHRLQPRAPPPPSAASRHLPSTRCRLSMSVMASVSADILTHVSADFETRRGSRGQTGAHD